VQAPAKPATTNQQKPVASAKPVAERSTEPPAQPKQTSLTQSLPAADPPPVAKQEEAKQTTPVDEAPAVSLREHFSVTSGAAGNDSVIAADPPAVVDLSESTVPSVQPDEVISSQLPPVPESASSTTLAQAMRNGEVGQNIPRVSPWNIALLLMMMAGLILVAVKARGGLGNPFGALRQKNVNVIETISLAPGRQIVLVELRGSALVLGVTPQSINLLDKVPLELLEENYQPTVQQIIHREGAARANWATRPKVAAMGGAGGTVGPSMAPALGNSYGPPLQGRMSVAELRQQRSAAGNGFHSYRGNGSAQPPRIGQLRVTESTRPTGSDANGARPNKSELLDSLREQLRKLEE
jgi:flagellar biogenesis protein FliO